MKRMLVNANDPEECRIAIVEDGVLQELYVELSDRESYLGNIYKGKVVNLEPSIGAAFVSFGGNKNGFLHASDVVAAYSDSSVELMDILEGRVESDEGNVSAMLDDDEDGDADEEPADEEPADGEPADEEPADEEPADEEPAAEEPADEEPADDEPNGVEPNGIEPNGIEPNGVEPNGIEPNGVEADGVETGQEATTEPERSAGAGDEAEAPRRKGRSRGRRRSSKNGKTATADEAEAEPEETGSERSGEDSKGKRGRRRRGRPRTEGRRPRFPIQDLLKKGQEVVVQITKEGIGAKGPTLTTYLSLPGRSLVLMPSLPKCGVSRKIQDERERRRLKRIVKDLDRSSDGIGFIVRTAGVGKTGQDLKRDLEYLSKLWDVVVQRARVTRPPAPLYVESDLVLRTMRDLFATDIDEIVIDNELVHRRVCDFVEKLMPRFSDRIKHHDVHAPLFHAFGIEVSVEELYQPQVEMKHGSSIVIEQTEALVAIDVNSGKYKPGTSLEETAYRTNLDSIPEIVRQLRLRDLGGVIIIDFIDMTEERHRRNVERKFIDSLRGDRARINVGRISQFGMLEMTRQRVGPGLKRTVFQTCATCKGTSLVRTVQSKALSVMRAVRALLKLPGYTTLEIYANPEVASFLDNNKRRELSTLEDEMQRRVLTRPESSYPVDVVHYRFMRGDGTEAKVAIPAGLGVHA